MRKRTAAERFWTKVDLNGPAPEYAPHLGPCWLWTAGGDGKGYGNFYDGKRNIRAHRWSWIDANGPVPDGLELDHLCRVRHCVRPSHCEAVTSRVNVLRGQSRSALNAMKTHCKYGHEFTAANTYLWRGSRRCRECRHRVRLERRPWITRVRAECG